MCWQISDLLHSDEFDTLPMFNCAFPSNLRNPFTFRNLPIFKDRGCHLIRLPLTPSNLVQIWQILNLLEFIEFGSPDQFADITTATTSSTPTLATTPSPHSLKHSK